MTFLNVEREDISKQETASSVAISTDIERTVRQLEEKLEKEEFQCDNEPKEGNVIPLVAEELGNGQYYQESVCNLIKIIVIVQRLC